MAETAETNFDEFKRKDCLFVADWLKTEDLHKLCSVLKTDLCIKYIKIVFYNINNSFLSAITSRGQ